MALANTINIRRMADSLGVIGSVTCTIHCLLLPALLVAGTSIPSVLVSEHTFHLLLAFLVIPAALIAFTLGCKRHEDRWVLALGVSGLLTMTIISVAGHDVPGHVWERVLMVAASCALVTAHIRNYRLCQHSVCKHAEDG